MRRLGSRAKIAIGGEMFLVMLGLALGVPITIVFPGWLKLLGVAFVIPCAVCSMLAIMIYRDEPKI